MGHNILKITIGTAIMGGIAFVYLPLHPKLKKQLLQIASSIDSIIHPKQRELQFELVKRSGSPVMDVSLDMVQNNSSNYLLIEYNVEKTMISISSVEDADNLAIHHCHGSGLLENMLMVEEYANYEYCCEYPIEYTSECIDLENEFLTEEYSFYGYFDEYPMEYTSYFGHECRRVHILWLL
jgi:hypothetical protein